MKNKLIQKLIHCDRHMEDGCSKRFEVGMLEAPTETFAMDQAKISEAKPTDLGTLPAPISAAMIMPPVPNMTADRTMSMENAFAARVDSWR